MGQSAAAFQNRYPYSGKIICEEHSAAFHRQILKSKSGEQEVWQCRVYRQRGRACCTAPQVKSAELDGIMAAIFLDAVTEKEQLISELTKLIRAAAEEKDDTHELERLEGEVRRLEAKKDKLLEMSIRGMISNEELKARNDGFNQQIEVLRKRYGGIEADRKKRDSNAERLEAIKTAIESKLLQKEIDSELITTILEKIVVKRQSSREQLMLDIYLKSGEQYSAEYDRKKLSFRLES